MRIRNLIIVFAVACLFMAFGSVQAFATTDATADVYETPASATATLDTGTTSGGNSGQSESAPSAQPVSESAAGNALSQQQASESGTGNAGADVPITDDQPSGTAEQLLTQAVVEPASLAPTGLGLSAMYDYSGANTGLWTFNPDSTGLAAPQFDWASGSGNWEWPRSKVVITDYNGDNVTEVAVLYGYDNANTGLWLFDPSGTGFSAPRLIWSSGNGNWEWSRSRLAAVDYNGDGKTELAILYGYNNAQTGLWLFDTNSTGFSAPRPVWFSGAGNWEWGRSRLAAADYDGDGKTGLAILYGYDNAQTGLWLFDPSGTDFSAPRPVWFSGAGNWEWGRSKLVMTDYNGDNKTELAILYGYDNAQTGLWLFDPSGTGFSAPRPIWFSGAGNWEWGRSRLATVDYNGDGKTELSILYGYDNAQTGLWLFDPSGTDFSAPRPVWFSGAGNWEWVRSKIPNGEHFKPRLYLISVTLFDVNLSNQTLTVYGQMYKEIEERYLVWTEGLYLTTPICSGKPGWETPTGVYRILSKELATDMSSGSDWGESYYVPNVPYVFWFIGTMYAVHGAYWLDDSQFGTPRSHGCVNIPVSVGALLFDHVPVGLLLRIRY